MIYIFDARKGSIETEDGHGTLQCGTLSGDVDSAVRGWLYVADAAGQVAAGETLAEALAAYETGQFI